MSYLPRMSKTYKEPQAAVLEDPEESISKNTLKPASSLLNEKTYNPQMALKHYRYLPHAPPVLPGPSVLDEAQENELFREASRMRRSYSKMETLTKASESVLEAPSGEVSSITLDESESKIETTEKVKRIHNRKGVKGNKSSLSRKRSSKTIKKDNVSNVTVNMCLTISEKPFTASEVDRQSDNLNTDSEFLSKHQLQALKREKSIFPVPTKDLYPVKQQQQQQQQQPTKEKQTSEKPEVKKKEFTNRSVQCTIFGSLSRVYVIPPIINSLLRTLAFLLHEINKEESLNSTSGEKKFPMTQIQLILGDLCNQKVEKDYGFDVTYSDFKRLEKILGELQKYMKDVYGDKGEYIDKMEDLKRVFIQSKSKEMELALLNEKLHDKEEKQEEEVVVKEEDLKNPEITLQNKRLECEQLTAEVEFGRREMSKYQRTIAELEWDIKNYQEQMISLKKSASSKSKTEVLGRKSSVHKFSSEILAKGSKSKDSENSFKRKT